ncbi:Na+/H+ antiporter subunit E [Rhizobium sp. SSA_523]|uniref:Na+/H+ antiporter subunit E n=1 Tax=Rhizobium sp. SSA_523 TaxID=2952477 RepID=UPI002091B826|nr:Na+/H+ antiporter subunit E [Rhizobium sp. SSA_523]MCO5731929.1 Na+/H+ antiporter subunit E [Rhizobium sp. SSA_523]WKC22719.1 Na+/H+ antiporter subunit E [Rhizobium sp. SSA_523]
MTAFTMNVLFAVVWVAVSGSATFLNFLFGFLVAALAIGLIREQAHGVSYLGRIGRIASLTILFFKELALSAWKVAVLVTRPRLAIKPGIFAFPLTVDRDFEITLLANLITLTPGTLSVDVSEDRRFLYVHAIDCSDVEGTRRDIAEGFERKIMEAFR